MIRWPENDYDAKRESCVRQISFAGLFATGIILAGSITFIVVISQAIDASIVQTSFIRSLIATSFGFSNLRSLFLGIAISIAIYAIILLIVGCINYRKIRQKALTSIKSWISAKISSAIFFILSYIAYLLWTALYTIVVFFCSTYYLLSTTCKALTMNAHNECFNLTIITPLLRFEVKQSPMIICGASIDRFCQLTEKATYNYYVSMIASGLVLLGIVHWLVYLATQYTHACWHDYQALLARLRDTTRQSLFNQHMMPTDDFAMNMYNPPPHISLHPCQRGLLRVTAR